MRHGFAVDQRWCVGDHARSIGRHRTASAQWWQEIPPTVRDRPTGIAQALGDVHRGDLDVLLVDLAPGTGDVTRTTLELVPGAPPLVVTVAQSTARTVAGRVGRVGRVGRKASDARTPIAEVVERATEHVGDVCGTRLPLAAAGLPVVPRSPVERPLSLAVA